MHKRVQMCWYLKTKPKKYPGEGEMPSSQPAARELGPAPACGPGPVGPGALLPPLLLPGWSGAACRWAGARGLASSRCCRRQGTLPSRSRTATADPRQRWGRLLGLGLETKPGCGPGRCRRAAARLPGPCGFACAVPGAAVPRLGLSGCSRRSRGIAAVALCACVSSKTLGRTLS